MTNAHGCDISTWQDSPQIPGNINFEKMRGQGIDFVFVKASQGRYIDPDFSRNWAGAKRAGIYRGAYHFLTWDVSPNAQADFFYNVMMADIGELPLIVDFEWWRQTPGNAMQILYGFCYRLRTLTAHPLGIYTSASFWRQYGSLARYWQQFHLWLCDISGPVEVPLPWSSWTFHQYTFKLDGLAHGVESKDLDGDWYNGTIDEMREEFRIEPPQKYTTFLPGVSNG